jgi:hypothetical protein
MAIGEDAGLASPEQPRAVVVQKPKANIYTALLALALVAIIVGCICLGAELNAYQWDLKGSAL